MCQTQTAHIPNEAQKRPVGARRVLQLISPRQTPPIDSQFRSRTLIFARSFKWIMPHKIWTEWSQLDEPQDLESKPVSNRSTIGIL